MAISFASGAIANSATSAFGAGTMSSSWSIANITSAGVDNAVSFGFGSTQTTILFNGGALVTLQGGVFETAAGTNIFSNAGTASGNFGITGNIPTFS